MKKLIFCLLGAVMFSACTRKVPTTPVVNTPFLFRLISLQADNISEEITGNDEIHLMVWHLKDSSGATVILKKGQDSLLFSSLNLSTPQELDFSDTIRSTAKETLLLLLLEVDTEKPFSQRAEEITLIMQQANYQVTDSLISQLNRSLMDDDILVVGHYHFKPLSYNPSQTIVLEGVHLFDKFRYRLRYACN